MYLQIMKKTKTASRFLEKGLRAFAEMRFFWFVRSGPNKCDLVVLVSLRPPVGLESGPHGVLGSFEIGRM